MLARTSQSPSDPPHLVLRAEGGVGRGVGHLARCFALGQAWVGRGGRCTLVSSAVPEPWASRYAAASISVAAPGTAIDADWWLVDGYDLTVDAEAGGARLARIDDHALSPHDPVAVLIDQNLGASAEPYADWADDVLAGTRYALLRADLVEAAAGSAGDRGDGPLHLVVAQGGSPSDEVRHALAEIVGGLDDAGPRITVLDGGDDVGPILATADLALAPSGSTAWELALFGVPSVFVAVAPNQVPLGVALADAGAGRFLGDLGSNAPAAVGAAVRALATDSAERERLRAAMRTLVDGRGAQRVVARLRSELVTLRAADGGDAEAVYELNNEPGARAASFNPEPIAWDDHVRWFATRVDDPATPIFLATDQAGNRLGLIRFVIDGDVAEVSVVVDAAQRGRGWAPALIDAGVRKFWSINATAVRVDALVKDDNVASARAFVDADFDEVPSTDADVRRFERLRSARTATR